MALADWLRRLLGLAENQPTPWPPPHLRQQIRDVEGYRRRLENDRDALLKADREYANASAEKRRYYTPVPLAREIVGLSAALLFSEEPSLTNEDNQQLLDSVVSANGLSAFLLGAAESVAGEGFRGLRVIRDEEVSDYPLIADVPADRVIFKERHGRFIAGGWAIIERKPNPYESTTYRLVEEHSPGFIERTLYKGTDGRDGTLGSPRPLNELEEFRGLPERTETRLNAPTLYRWDNVPGSYSDLYGLGPLLDRLNHYESIGAEKVWKSVPISVADRKLADRQGSVDLHGVILTGGQGSTFGEDGVAKTVATIQPDLQSEEHIAYIRHLRDSIIMYARYSLASWGLDQGGSADSGKALRLRQARTLLTKAGKERMAREAIRKPVGAACAWSEGAREVEPYLPEVEFGDGLPVDSLERAQEVNNLRSSEAISAEEAVRYLHPDWPDERIQEEVDRIEGERAGPEVRTPRLNLEEEE